MRDHKAVEETRLRDGPGLVSATTVVLVDQYDGDGVDGGNGDGDFPVKCPIVEAMVDAEGSSKRALVFWRRERERVGRWRDVEQP